MFRIRRFGIMKTATTVAVLYMVAIAIFVVPFTLLFAIAGTSVSSGVGNVSMGLGSIIAFGLVAIVGYGVLAWIFTALACAIYNLVAGWVGGVEIQLDAVAPLPGVPAWGQSTTPPPPPAPPAAPPPDAAPPSPPATRPPDAAPPTS